MNRNFRLTQSTDFKRVRRSGKSYAHPLIVLVVLPADGMPTRFGVTAGRSVGNAVQRNRAKRLIREGLRPLLPLVHPGWKVILISRNPIRNANLTEIIDALHLIFL
ncbi:MAG: ribonuclease P protein component, partial [Chloroflexi bacterium RBG_13_48_10]